MRQPFTEPRRWKWFQPAVTYAGTVIFEKSGILSSQYPFISGYFSAMAPWSSMPFRPQAPAVAKFVNWMQGMPPS